MDRGRTFRWLFRNRPEGLGHGRGLPAGARSRRALLRFRGPRRLARIRQPRRRQPRARDPDRRNDRADTHVGIETLTIGVMPTASAEAGTIRLPKALSFRGCASAQTWSRLFRVCSRETDSGSPLRAVRNDQKTFRLPARPRLQLPALIVANVGAVCAAMASR